MSISTRFKSAATFASVALLLGACGTSAPAADDVLVVETDVVEVTEAAPVGDGVTLEYWMWDDLQAPLYRQCAAKFTENTGVNVNISTTNTAQYFQNLTTQMTAGTAPDVFVNNVVNLRQYAASGQLEDLDALSASEGVDFDLFMPGLAENFVLDGHRYGLPKDWDTVGIFYNAELAREAGYTPEQINELTFDADGGTFETFVRALTIDANGRNANDPDFDANHVVRNGWLTTWTDAHGQTTWGAFAHALGFTVFNEDGSTNFGTQPFKDTMRWFQKMVNAGVIPQLAEGSTLPNSTLIEQGSGAAGLNGSWAAQTFFADNMPEIGIARVPIGPAGRFAATNGLADSIWTGSHHKPEAAEFVKYLATPECQELVGEAGLIFPAIESASEAAVAARDAQGIDSTAFLEQMENGETYMIPVYRNGAEVTDLMTQAQREIVQGADVDATMDAFAARINALERG